VSFAAVDDVAAGQQPHGMMVDMVVAQGGCRLNLMMVWRVEASAVATDRGSTIDKLGWSSS
jgi:hypothetical protein